MEMVEVGLISGAVVTLVAGAIVTADDTCSHVIALEVAIETVGADVIVTGTTLSFKLSCDLVILRKFS